MTRSSESIELVDAAPSCALAIYAHPDDADVSCGGTLARWARDGADVHIAICAQGDKGTSDPQADVAELVRARVLEAEQAASVLGVKSVHLLGRRDGEFENDLLLRGDLVALIRELRPDALVCPDPTAIFFGEHYFNHRDHRVVGFAALDAAAPAASSPLYFPDRGDAFAVAVAYLSGSLEPSVVVDIADTVEQKADAVACHKSQLGETAEWFRAVVRERAEEAGRLAGVRFAEPFRRIALSH